MDLDEARQYLRENHHSILATTRADGRPQLSPVVHGVGAEGRILISTREPAYKVRNIRRDAGVSLCAISDAFFGKWVQVDGTASILSLPEAMEVLVDLYRQVAGEHPDWVEYRAAMQTDRRCVICIDLERAGPDRSA